VFPGFLSQQLHLAVSFRLLLELSNPAQFQTRQDHSISSRTEFPTALRVGVFKFLRPKRLGFYSWGFQVSLPTAAISQSVF
jgi:hypothetical protein